MGTPKSFILVGLSVVNHPAITIMVPTFMVIYGFGQIYQLSEQTVAAPNVCRVMKFMHPLRQAPSFPSSFNVCLPQ